MPTYWCTAMYAVGRSYAVERSASSGATTRSSIGKPIGSRRRSISASTRSSASAARLARDRVLHLREADEASVGVDAVARVEVLGAAHQPGEPAVEQRDQPGEAAPEPAERAEHGVLQHHVVEKRCRAPRRLGGAVRALGGERERPARVGHHERLPVVVRVHQLVEPRQHVVERARLVDAVDGEGGHAAQRDRGDGAERAEAYTRRAQLVALADIQHLARARDQSHARSPARRGCRIRRRCRAWRSRSRPPASEGPRRPGSPSPGRGRAAARPGRAA